MQNQKRPEWLEGAGWGRVFQDEELLQKKQGVKTQLGDYVVELEEKSELNEGALMQVSCQVV